MSNNIKNNNIKKNNIKKNNIKNNNINSNTSDSSHISFQRERTLILVLGGLFVMVLLGHWFFPLTPDTVAVLLPKLGFSPHLGGHNFVDKRTWLGIFNAADVLSNIPYAVFGFFGLWRLSFLSRAQKQHGVTENSPVINTSLRWILQIFFLGLICVMLGSSLYHLKPNDFTLLWDRAGMAVTFSGIFALTVYDRVSIKAGMYTLVFMLISAMLALWVWNNTGDVLSWSVVQFGTIAVILWLAFLKPTNINKNTDKLSLISLATYYGLAKVFEASDAAVFELSSNWVSGHTLKHLVSSLVALPVVSAFLQRKYK